MNVDQTPSKKAKRNLAVFERLYRKWVTPVYRYFRYRVNSDKEAEDLTSQVFLKVCEHLPNYKEDGRFPAWLFTIVRNQSADFFRTQKPTISLEEVDLSDDRVNPQEQAALKDDLNRLKRLLRALSEKDQEMIQLRYVAQLPYKDIAAILGGTRDAVRKQVNRLLARLEDQMEENHV
jgi:RNA polymerase sigma-70 factor (ECF subfamily)